MIIELSITFKDGYKDTRQIIGTTESLNNWIRDILTWGIAVQKPEYRFYSKHEVESIQIIPNHLMSRGFCLWFTGLSGSGKSTLAVELAKLLETKGRTVTLLDGDNIRDTLSKDLSFTKEDRDTNIRRIGFLAKEIVRHGGAVITSTISPYDSTRDEMRLSIDNCYLIYINTPLEVCEQRDPKGLYAKVRQGLINNFTGIDDIYEEPENPDIVIDTVDYTAKENAQYLLNYLVTKGFIK